MRYRLLGPLEVVREEGGPVELGPPKQRAVLAVLLLDRGRIVSNDRLIDAVWGDDAPPSAMASIQAYVSNLRRALRDEAGATSPILRRAPGYVLEVTGEQVDVVAFADRADAVRRAVDGGAWAEALELADEALAIWRGPLLADLADEDWVQVEATGPEELRTECRERRVTALLALRRTAPALVEAQQLRAEHPLRERACWLHALSLHRSGRSPEALAELRHHTARLDDELGLEPGVELRDLQTAILRQDPALAAWPRSPQWSGAAQLHTPAPDTPAPGPAPAPVRIEGGDLIGRERETAILEQVLAEVRSGGTRWLVLTGPAGIGKSRLAHEFSRQLGSGGAGRVVWARCPEEDGAPAWWPVRQLVASLGGDPDPVLVPPGGVEADEARFVVYERVQRMLEAYVADGTPLAVVIDDVQWADPTSVRCISYLAGALRDVPIAMALTLRDQEGEPAGLQRMLGALARTPGNRQLAVPPLAPAEVGALAGQVSGERFSPGQARRLAERTGGNPLFVSEYARLPAEERLGAGIPIAVRSVLGRRLAGLDPAVLQVLRTAAVLGDVVEVDTLAEVTRLDLDTLADYLDEAADEHILVAAPGTAGYAFAHGLLREEVLAAMPALRRQRMHARIAAVLADATDGERLSRRAQHLLAALPLVDPAEVLAGCRAAARDSEQRWSSETASRWWEASLRAYDLLPAAARAQQQFDRDDLLVNRVEALGRAGRGQQVLDVVDAGLLDAVREGRTSAAGRLAAALLRSDGAWPWTVYGEAPGPVLARLAGVEPLLVGDPAAHARVLATLAVGSCYDPDPAVPDGLSARAIAIAESLGDPDVIADAVLGRVYTYIGVATHAHEAVELLDRLVSLPHRQSQVDDVIRHAMLSMTLMNLGDTAAAAEHVRRAIAGSDLLRLPVIRVQMRWMQGELAEWRGDFDSAAKEFATAVEIHRQTELYVAGTTDIALHSTLWHRGRVAELPPDTIVEPMVWGAARAAARGETGAAAEKITRWLATPAPTVWTTLGHQVLAAHLVADLGLREHAEDLIARLTPFTDRIANIGQVGQVGSVASATGRLHLLLGRPDEARTLLAQARDLAERTGGLPTLLSCRLNVALMDDDPAGRRAELAAVAEQAARIGMVHIERAALAGLSGLSGQPT